MARRRKACGFCEDNNYGNYIEHRNGYCLWYEFYPFHQNLSVICQAKLIDEAEGET